MILEGTWKKAVWSAWKRSAFALLLLGPTLELFPDAFDAAFRFEDLDLDQCRAWQGQENQSPDPRIFKHVLGFEEQGRHELRRWEGPNKPAPDGQRPLCHFHLAFRKPVTIGTVLGHSGKLWYLKPDAAYPGNPDQPGDWLEADSWSNQSGIRSFVLPAGAATRAVFCSMSPHWDGSPPRIEIWRFFKARLLNACPLGIANASEEYTPPPPPLGARPPKHDVKVLTNGGWPHWQNTGKDGEGLHRRADIDKLNPVWVTVSWQKPQEIVGILPMGECGGIELSWFNGPAHLPPSAGTRREWRRLPYQPGPAGILQFPKPVKTRGLRLTITQSGREGKIATLYGLHVYTKLGEAALPRFYAKGHAPSPVQIPYELTRDGLLSLVLDDDKGHRIRNFFALNERKAGSHQQDWDGKDLDGRYVSPGNYTWKAIACKPIELHYQFTVYPNIKENTPWQIGHTGPGGWLADHTPPEAACAWGDRVWLGASCAESGVSFIECDLQGRKIAGWHSFEDWTGPRFLASDGKTVFVSHPKENDDPVWAYDLATRTVRSLFRQPATETRATGIRGMAARDGKLYLSICASNTWVVKPFGSPSVDIENCVPRYAPARKPRKPYEVVDNPRRDFLRLFRLEGTPPGQGVGLTYLETSAEPEAGRRHHILLALNKPQPIGSAVFPFPPELADKQMRFYLSVLKPDAPYPPNPEDKSQWIVLEESAKTEWDIVPFPPGMLTRALRLTWEKVEGDPLANVEEDFGREGEREKAGLELDSMGIKEQEEKSGPRWKANLEGMTFLRRRFNNLLHTATVRVNSGEYRPNGEWWAAPKNPISYAEPGIFLMEWQRPVKVRGLVIKEIDGQTTEIDVFSGPASAPVTFEDSENWEKVSTYHQRRRDWYYPGDDHNPRARYMDGLVDFHHEYETRAIRLRVVQTFQPVEGRPLGVRDDRGSKDIDPRRCRVYGIAPLGYLGGEAPVDSRQTERIAVYDLEKGAYVQEVSVGYPGQIALGPSGDLYAVSGNKIVRVDLAAESDASRHQTIIEDLQWPSALAVDPLSRLYVFDNARERQVIRVYDSTGKFLKTIGTPGGRKAGPWDVSRFQNVTSMAIDKDGGLWVVECAYDPKRISKWTAEGEFVAEFLGPAQYGGGGVLDPYDKTRLYYHNMEFELNWETGASRLKNLTWTGWSEAGEVPLIYQGRKYLVTRGEEGRGAAIVYLYEQDHLKLAGALGRADAFPYLQDPKVLTPLGGVSLPNYHFLWSDHSGDGEVQAEEVAIKPLSGNKGSRYRSFHRDLSIQSGPAYFGIKEILPHGAPVWEEQEFQRITAFPDREQIFSRLADGNFFHFGRHHGVITPEGELLWKWETEGITGHALPHARPYFPGQACAEFFNICHPNSMAAPSQGELGPFQVHNSNPAAWNIWTHDGLLAGYLFRDQRHWGTPSWSMPEHSRGLRLDNHEPGQEHFSGYFCRTSDDKYYIVAGHNHISIVEVKGLETFRRMTGPLQLSSEDLQKLKNWEIEQQSQQVYARSPVYDLYRLKAAPQIDGDPRDWDQIPEAAMDSGDPDREPPASFKMGYDDKNLYVFYDVRYGPLKNSGGDWRALFKTGASVDLQMSVNPGAAEDRTAPVEGDQRLLLTYLENKRPVAVLYRPVAPSAPEGNAYEVVSPVSRISFDEVRHVEGLRIARGGGRGYTLEAAIPLSELGFSPKLGQRYRMDWGILTTDNYGNACTGRLYWSNKATGILADAPSEAVLMPHLWGYLRVNEDLRSGPADLHSLSSLEGKEGETMDAIDVEEEFESD